MTDATPKLSVCIEMIFSDRPFPERIRHAADAGADAVEFWNWQDKNLNVIAETCDSVGVDLAAMVGSDSPLTDPEHHDEAATDIRESIETAERLDCPNLIVTVGQEQEELDREEQHNCIISVLREVAGDAKDAGVTLAVEPLNTAVDHPGYYLTSSYEGYEIVETVDSPNVRLLFDVYHQQITEGNIIANATEHINGIGYVHVADVPGRHEPGTGELNYSNVIGALIDAEYDGYVGCEFHPTDNDTVAVKNCRKALDANRD